ncbi:MAG TPA: hypothetical protein VK585_02650 [Jiangellaceae bacterium]|nr:hypothetical protein [Jiangellaceae bacterium]
MLCATGATVLWTRHRRQPEVVPRILGWFAAAGFAEIDVVMPAGSTSTIGSHRLSAPPQGR